MSRNSKSVRSAVGKLGLTTVLGAGIGTAVGAALGNVPAGVALGAALGVAGGALFEFIQRRKRGSK
ncbi:MAG: hypothetical protein IT331_17040 [Anaerolineae bacterium]|nr:hypothetical protein [Anaerolineae bacterium]